MKDIKELREQINEIDSQMAELFEKRMGIAKEIAFFKKENGLSIYDKNREDFIVNQNMQFIKDATVKSYYVNFIKSVMEQSKNYQTQILSGMKIAYSGVPGAFAYIAAKKMYPNANYIAFPDFESAYKACESGAVDAVILPIENSFAGDVGIVMDLIFQGSLKINQMCDLEIVQNLLGVKGATKESIKTVISHPQALSQSNDFLTKHGYIKKEFANTALAAQEVKELNDISYGAVASLETAELYGLEVIAEHINSSNNNSTRFAAFTRVNRVPNPENKMGEHFILVYTVINEAGALAQTLNIIGSHGFNMRNVRSRPMKELLWNYYFFVEIEGNVNSPDGRELLNELSTICDRLKLVGTYFDFKDK